MKPTAILKLKKHEERRIQAGHLWIYSNEVDVAATPLAAFQPGEIAVVENAKGEPLGSAYVNPHTLICARIFSREIESLSVEFFEKKLLQALQWRTQLFSKPFYRLIFAEGDYLPGVIIDRYGDHYVVQITTAGMEAAKDSLLTAMKNILKPESVLWRNDTGARDLEKLPKYVEPAFGHPPEYVEITEENAIFAVPILTGQKTGWFFDQRNNRKLFLSFAKNARVLDVCSYLGAWGIGALKAGAQHVTCVDVSAQACTWLQKNAELNHCEKDLNIINDDAFDALLKLKNAGEKFSLIVLDPPAFIKRKKDFNAGFAAYRKLNQLGLELLEEGGLLFSASCSMHLSEIDLWSAIQQAGARANVETQIVFRGGQGPDHPVHPAIPETSYLKMYTIRKEPRAQASVTEF